jgi:ABC-type glucose/galactose transport system permease subunit
MAYTTHQFTMSCTHTVAGIGVTTGTDLCTNTPFALRAIIGKKMLAAIGDFDI